MRSSFYFIVITFCYIKIKIYFLGFVADFFLNLKNLKELSLCNKL